MTTMKTDSDRIPWRESLATRLSLNTIILVLLSILLVGCFLIWIAFTTEQGSAQQLQSTNAEMISVLISDFIDNAVNRLEVFEESWNLDTLTPEKQYSALLELMITTRPLFSELTVYDLSGYELTRVSRFHTYLPGELKKNVSDESYLVARSGRLSISQIYIPEQSGLLSMRISLPLRNDQEMISGVLSAEVNCVGLWQKIATVDTGSAGYAYFVDKSGRFIAYQDISEVLNRYNEDMSQIPPVAAFTSDSGKNGHIYRYPGFLGDPVIGAYAPVRGTDWAVIAEMPESVALAGVRQMMMYLIVILISCVVIAGGVGYFMSLRLVEPLEDMTVTARLLGSGKWDTQILHGERNDEVGVLSRTLSRMRDELKGVYADLAMQLGEVSRVQEQLKLSEELYRTIFEKNGNAILVIEEDMTIAIINHKLEQMWGYSKEEVEGKKSWTSFIADPQELERMTAYHRNRRTDGTDTPDSYEFSFKCRSGDLLTVIATVTMIPGTRRSLAALIDITGKKQVETALLQARKKLNLLNRLTFNDIRSSVYVLAGYIDLSRDMVTDSAMISWIEKEKETIRQVDKALVFARDFQDMGLKPAEWQNVEQVFLYAISHLEISSFSRSLDLTGLEIYADPLLEKVFVTLVSNTLTHGGNVSSFSIWYTRSVEEVVIIYEDDGSGIPQEMKEKIFEEYAGEKKGISLFFSREILGITDIRIQESGREGTGARFEIMVPRGKFRVSDDSAGSGRFR